MKIFISSIQKINNKNPINLEIKIIGVYICCYYGHFIGVIFTQIWSYSTSNRCSNIGASHRVTVYPSLPPTTSHDFLSILTVDFPSLLRSSVNLTFGRKRCSESVVVSLLHLLLPCFSQCRLTRTLTQIQPLQPWLEAALVGIRMYSLEHKNRGPTLQG